MLLLVAVVLVAVPLVAPEEVELELSEGVELVVGAGVVLGAAPLLPDEFPCEEP